MSQLAKILPITLLALATLSSCSSPASSNTVDDNSVPTLFISSEKNIAYEVDYTRCSTPSALLSNGVIISENSKGSPLPLFLGENRISTLEDCQASLSLYSLSVNNSFTEELYVGSADLTIIRSPINEVQVASVTPRDLKIMKDSVTIWSQERPQNRRERWESFKRLVGGDGPDTRRLLSHFPVSDDNYGHVTGFTSLNAVSIPVYHSGVVLHLVFDSSVYANHSSPVGEPTAIAYDANGEEVWSVLFVAMDNDWKPIAFLNITETLEAVRVIVNG